jgi:hypothetical protein
MRRNLVIARVGASSLHPEWIDDAQERDWDLYLCPYQPIPDQSGLDCTVGEVITGPKWTGIRELLSRWDGWRDYEKVWLPDDDIRADPHVIEAMFDVAGRLGLQLFAPALDEGSYYAHFDTMRNTSCYARRGGWVEIMVPAFTREALELVLPTLDETETGWGWGLDSVWPKLLGYEGIGIIDGLAVTHTRPVGEMRDEELRRRVLAESDALFERYDCRQVHTTFEAIGEDLEPLDLTPEELLVELVRGWQYLIDRDPRLLPWIVDYQGQHFGWRPYPVEGTP